jgi:hypothetical protein
VRDGASACARASSKRRIMKASSHTLHLLMMSVCACIWGVCFYMRTYSTSARLIGTCPACFGGALTVFGHMHAKQTVEHVAPHYSSRHAQFQWIEIHVGDLVVTLQGRHTRVTHSACTTHTDTTLQPSHIFHKQGLIQIRASTSFPLHVRGSRCTETNTYMSKASTHDTWQHYLPRQIMARPGCAHAHSVSRQTLFLVSAILRWGMYGG